MTFARFHLLRQCLLGLYLIAQVVGVFPLVYGHAFIVSETTPAAGHVHLAADAGRRDTNQHHHGFADCRDQCCAICSLTGPLPPNASLALREREAAPAPLAVSAALISWHPSRLDRPPKPNV
jgi:hypothetical protein